MKLKLVLTLVILSSLLSAVKLNEPMRMELRDGMVIDLGNIGPGQTISFSIDRKTTEGGLYGDGGYYDKAVVTTLPEGWSGKDSKLYDNPLFVSITADKNASEGIYYTDITIIDENYGEKLDNITITVIIEITWDVLDIDITPTAVTTGPSQPARYSVLVTNKGTASDVFMITAEGSKRWEFKKYLFVPANSTRTTTYEIVENEEGVYKHSINVVSTASQIINEGGEITLNVNSDLTGDLKATNNGIIIFPLFETTIYSLAGLISNLFN